MIYAPIYIPTLNRYAHLKRCIESLQKNSWAEYTEIYISLDYPTKESHWEGYNKIKEYLESGISGFKAVHFFIQEKNLGPSENIKFLRKEIFKTYDRFIGTEDDNQFSPNFIEYMDKGLELFKDNDECIFISGYVDEQPWNAHGGTVMPSTLASFWGYGGWKNKLEKCQKEINKELFVSIGTNPYYIWRLYYYSRIMLWWYVHRYLCDPYEAFTDQEGNPKFIDVSINIYCIVKRKYIIVPVKSLVRNWGMDGSGVHCGTDVKYNAGCFSIDENEHFEYRIPRPFTMRNDNRKIQAATKASLKWKDNVKVLQNLVLFELLGFERYHKLLKKQEEIRNRKR